MTEIVSAEEVRHVTSPYQNTEAYKLLRTYGELDTYSTATGDFITVLPTCTVDMIQLLPENWYRPMGVGNARIVKHIKALNDGTPAGLFEKSPERIFTRDLYFLNRGEVWWGGPRSGEKTVKIYHNPVIEEQTLWETITLLELIYKGIRAEVPQAILCNSRGENSLIVQEIPTTTQTVPLKGPTDNDMNKLIKNLTTLKPDDFTRQNCLLDLQGYLHVIDVNRWYWPPNSDDFRKRLVEEVKAACK